MDLHPVTPETVAVLQRVRVVWRPPTTLKISEFADQEIILTTGPLAGTHWQTDFAPYQRAIMDALLEPGVQVVVVQGSSQWGKTACAVNVVAYHMAHSPCPILVVEPTVDPMAKDFAKNRLEPVIAASPLLRETVGKKRAKDGSNTTLLKTFRGGSVSIGGANSAASLAARTILLLVLDEVDRYPAELPGEGSTLAIAFKRTESYGRRRRVLMISSPTVEGAPIHVWHARGDQRRYFVPCPACRTMHPYEWRNVRWTDQDPGTARLHCPACDYAIDDAERVAILSDGEWRVREDLQEGRDRSIVSFHIWEAYSPLSSLRTIVTNFLRAREQQKAGDEAEMHTWQNTTLGEPVVSKTGEGVDPDWLMARREVYSAAVPASACCLTAGIDVQNDRLEVLVVGWAPGESSWVVDHQVLWGDTSQPAVWTDLDRVLETRYVHATAERLGIFAACVDSGDRTATVYRYAAPRLGRKIYAIKGRAKADLTAKKAQPIPLSGGGQVHLFTVGVDAAKALIAKRLALDLTADGAIHLPQADWITDEFLAQLTSERQFRRMHKGVPVFEWRRIRERNEVLDAFVYALAALRLSQVNLSDLAERLAGTRPTRPPAPTPRPRWIPPRPQRRWLKGR